MAYRLSVGTVRESRRQATYVVRVHDTLLPLAEIDAIIATMRERLDARGEITAEVVVVQGHSKETLRLFGNPFSVSIVRSAMFNAAIGWKPLTLD